MGLQVIFLFGKLYSITLPLFTSLDGILLLVTSLPLFTTVDGILFRILFQCAAPFYHCGRDSIVLAPIHVQDSVQLFNTITWLWNTNLL